MAYVIGSTGVFQLTATKDGVVWNLAGATVTLLLKPPAGATTTYAATVTSAATGEAEYTINTNDIAVPGYWSYAWRVVQGAVDLCSEPIPLAVVSSP